MAGKVKARCVYKQRESLKLSLFGIIAHLRPRTCFYGCAFGCYFLSDVLIVYIASAHSSALALLALCALLLARSLYTAAPVCLSLLDGRGQCRSDQDH